MWFAHTRGRVTKLIRFRLIFETHKNFELTHISNIFFIHEIPILIYFESDFTIFKTYMTWQLHLNFPDFISENLESNRKKNLQRRKLKFNIYADLAAMENQMENQTISYEMVFDAFLTKKNSYGYLDVVNNCWNVFGFYYILCFYVAWFNWIIRLVLLTDDWLLVWMIIGVNVLLRV